MKSLHESILSQMGMGENSPVLLKALLPLKVITAFYSVAVEGKESPFEKIVYGIFREDRCYAKLYLSDNIKDIRQKKNNVLNWIDEIISGVNIRQFFSRYSAFITDGIHGKCWMSISPEQEMRGGGFSIRFIFYKEFYDEHSKEFNEIIKGLEKNATGCEIIKRNK